MTIPGQGIDFVRDDIAGSMSRTRVTSNPGDEAVMIPAAGFNLGATITHPANAAGRVPAAADALLPRVLASATPSAALLTSLLDPAGLSDALR